MANEKFTTFITAAPVRTLDGSELLPLVTSVPNTSQQTLANVVIWALSLAFPNMVFRSNVNSPGLTASLPIADLLTDPPTTVQCRVEATLINHGVGTGGTATITVTWGDESGGRTITSAAMNLNNVGVQFVQLEFLIAPKPHVPIRYQVDFVAPTGAPVCDFQIAMSPCYG